MKRRKVRRDVELAPGDLSIVHALLNTVDAEENRDELASPKALARWLERHGLLEAGVDLGDADLERVRQVRRGWRSLLAGAAKKEEIEEKEILRELDRATAGATFRTRHWAGGVIRFEPRANGFDGALEQLLKIAGDAQADDTWGLLKLCASPTCRTVFYDRSTNHSGKWCRTRCGNRISSRRSKRRSRRFCRQYEEEQKAFETLRKLRSRVSQGTAGRSPGTRESED